MFKKYFAHKFHDEPHLNYIDIEFRPVDFINEESKLKIRDKDMTEKNV